MNRIDVLVGRRLHGEPAVIDCLLHFARVRIRHGTVVRKVALGTNNDNKHLVLSLVLDVLGPLD